MLIKKNNSQLFLYVIFILVSIVLTAGCGQKSPSGKVVVKINSYTSTMGEFEELFSEMNFYSDSPQAREVFLNNLIRRKVILQEAQNRGLDKDKDFLRTVEKYWEQTLLKEMISDEVDEISGKTTVSESELKQYFSDRAKADPGDTRTYAQMKDMLKKELLRKKQKESLNEWIEELRQKADIWVDKRSIGLETK